MAASHVHLLVYVNGCFTCTSVGVCEWRLYMYICWCIRTAVSHVHLLVYKNGCFTCTSVGVCEWLLHTYICWCTWI